MLVFSILLCSFVFAADSGFYYPTAPTNDDTMTTTFWCGIKITPEVDTYIDNVSVSINSGADRFQIRNNGGGTVYEDLPICTTGSEFILCSASSYKLTGGTEYYLTTTSGANNSYACRRIAIGTSNYKNYLNETSPFVAVTGSGYSGDSARDTEAIEFYNVTYTDLGPETPDTLNLTGSQPVDESSFNHIPLYFNITVNSTNDFNCSLYINGTLNQSDNNNPAGENQDISLPVNIDEGEYEYYWQCVNSNGTESTTNLTFYIDFSKPIITATNFTNQSAYYNSYINAQWNVSDNINLYRYNISVNNVEHASGLLNGITNEINMSVYSGDYVGVTPVLVEVWDGHTASELNYTDWEVKQPILNDWVEYELKSTKKSVKIKGLSGYIWDKFNTELKKDRYCFEYEPADKYKTNYEFEVESDTPIHIRNAPDTPWKKWLIMDNRWLDFETEEGSYETITLEHITPYRVKVTLNNVELSEGKKIKFNSIGELNKIERYYEFVSINATETFETALIGGFNAYYTLNITGEASTDYNAKLNWNGTNYSIESDITATYSYYNITISTPQVTETQNITHQWYFNKTGTATTFLNETNQTLYNVDIGNCSGSRTYKVANLSYSDALTGIPLNATNTYSTRFFDGTYYYSSSGLFSGARTSDPFCTNLPNSTINYTWELFGNITLEKDTYITKTLQIPQGAGLTVRNFNVPIINISMIGTLNSSTITYTWLTDTFQSVTGTMLIYQCAADGTKTLYDTIAVVGGQGAANIDFFETQYSYEIVIDGVRYAQEGFSTCHVESVAERTFYVTVTQNEVPQLTGLALTTCNIYNDTNSTVTMEWGENPNNPTTNVTGCLQAFRYSVNGWTQIFENCSSTTNVLVNSIPSSGYDYFARGKLTQNGSIVYCQDQVYFYTKTTASEMLGITGLFAVVLLVLACALFWTSDGPVALIASAIGLIIAWVIGIVSYPWPLVTGIFVFIAVILYIGRMVRKG